MVYLMASQALNSSDYHGESGGGLLTADFQVNIVCAFLLLTWK